MTVAQVAESFDVELPKAKKERAPVVRTGISAKSFVLAWQKSNSPAEVCKKLGLDEDRIPTVCARAAGLRKAGVTNLKKMRRGASGPRLDIQSLNDLIESIDDENEQTEEV